MKKINIKRRSNNVFIDTPCILCGELFDPKDTIHSLYENDSVCGDVCEHCFENAQNGKTDRIERHIQRLNDEASWLHQIRMAL